MVEEEVQQHIEFTLTDPSVGKLTVCNQLQQQSAELENKESHLEMELIP